MFKEGQIIRYRGHEGRLIYGDDPKDNIEITKGTLFRVAMAEENDIDVTLLSSGARYSGFSTANFESLSEQVFDER